MVIFAALGRFVLNLTRYRRGYAFHFQYKDYLSRTCFYVIQSIVRFRDYSY